MVGALERQETVGSTGASLPSQAGALRSQPVLH